jgi:hypothetical protein
MNDTIQHITDTAHHAIDSIDKIGISGGIGIAFTVAGLSAWFQAVNPILAGVSFIAGITLTLYTLFQKLRLKRKAKRG